MLQRATSLIMRVAQPQLPIRYIGLCSQPLQCFFFFNKADKDKESKLEKIEQLKSEYYETEEYTQQVEALKKIINIRQEMEKQDNKLCIELLLDKIELTSLQMNQNDEEYTELAEELMDDDLLDKVSFHNVDLSKHPSGYKEYQMQQLIKSLYSVKLIHQFDDQDNNKLNQMAEELNNAVEYCYNYQLKYFDEFEDIEQLYSKTIIKGVYHYFKSTYYEYKSRIALRENTIEQAITNLEQGLEQAQISYQIFVNEEHSDDAEAAQCACEEKERSLSKVGELFEQLGQIQVSIKEDVDSRPYFEKSLDIYLLVHGKFSIQYVNCYCALAYTYFHTEPHKTYTMSEELLQQVEHHKDQTVVCMLSMFHFCVSVHLAKQTVEFYEQCEKLLEVNTVENPSLNYDYHYFAAIHTLNTKQFDNAEDHLLMASDYLTDFENRMMSDKALLLVEKANMLPNTQKNKYFILSDLLDILDQSSFRYKELEDEELPDDDKNLLFLVEYQIAYLSIQLKEQYTYTAQQCVSPLNSFISYYKFQNEYEEMFVDKMWQFCHLLHVMGMTEQAQHYLDLTIKIINSKDDSKFKKECLAIFKKLQQTWNSQV